MVYLNNFPREGAVKGQEFSGDKKLEEELLKRGIIGNGKVEKKANVDAKELDDTNAKIEELEAKVYELEVFNDDAIAKNLELNAKIKELEAESEKLNGFVKEAIELPKGKAPEGYEDDL